MSPTDWSTTEDLDNRLILDLIRMGIHVAGFDAVLIKLQTKITAFTGVNPEVKVAARLAVAVFKSQPLESFLNFLSSGSFADIGAAEATDFTAAQRKAMIRQIALAAQDAIKDNVARIDTLAATAVPQPNLAA